MRRAQTPTGTGLSGERVACLVAPTIPRQEQRVFPGEEALGTQAGEIREDGVPGERSEGRQGSLSSDGKAVGSSAGKGKHREG